MNASKDGHSYKCKSCVKQYDLDNREKDKKWRLDNKEKLAKYNKRLYNDKKDHFLKYRNDWARSKKQNEPLFKLACSIRTRINDIFRKQGYSKNSKSNEILGCSFEEFKLHLEKQFTKGMSWENQGDWHLDHIYPVSLARDEQHLIELNHYTNFQPLWAFDNLSKGNKIIEKQLFLI